MISTIDLGNMIRSHVDRNALATLAVKARPTSRYLLFDENLQLCGRRSVRDQKLEVVRPVQNPLELAFAGIHIVSPRILSLMTENGAFSIISSYLRIAGLGEKILGFRADDYNWRDLGTPENLKEAAAELEVQRRGEV